MSGIAGRVEAHLRKHPGASAREIAADLDVTRMYVSACIRSLEDRVVASPDAEDARVVRYHLRDVAPPHVLPRFDGALPAKPTPAPPASDGMLSALGRIEQLLVRLLRHLGGQ